MPVTTSPIYHYCHDIVSGLINDQKAMVLKEISGETDTILELRVASSDAGKVVGRGGQTAAAIRLLLYAFSRKNGMGNVAFRVLNSIDDDLEKPINTKVKTFGW